MRGACHNPKILVFILQIHLDQWKESKKKCKREFSNKEFEAQKNFEAQTKLRAK